MLEACQDAEPGACATNAAESGMLPENARQTIDRNPYGAQ